MKTITGLWGRIVDRENLVSAAYQAGKGSRNKLQTRVFFDQFDVEIQRLFVELRDETLEVGPYHQFTIHDPKKRIISAPPYRDRVLHHALMNVCEPVFESRLVEESCACRLGKGQSAALRRAAHCAKRYRYFLKLDVRKYFDSIDHAVLLDQLCGVFREKPLLRVFGKIIRSYETIPGKGLPIGALTSQQFANFYLSPVDRWIKEEANVRGYVRYMDDFLLWHESRDALKRTLEELLRRLERLCLVAKPSPYINTASHGVDYLGFRIKRGRVHLDKRSRRRYRRRMRAVFLAYARGELTERNCQQRLEALTAFTSYGDACRFRARVLSDLRVWAAGLEPGDPGRCLEQLVQELPLGEPQQEHA